MLVLEWKGRAFQEKVNFRSFVDIWWPYWCTKTVHQCGFSIQRSTKVHGTFRQITQKLWATKTWDLGQLVYILVFYNILVSCFLSLDGFQFIFFVAWQWKRSIRRLGWWQPCCRDYRFLNKGDQRSLLAIVNHEKISLKLIEAFRYKTT